MPIFLEFLYFSINLILIVVFFLWPGTSNFNWKNFLLISLFFMLTGISYFWKKRIKKNPESDLLNYFNFYPILRGYLQSLRNDLGDWFFCSIIVFLVKPFLFDICLIPSGSMNPTFWEGDRVFISRIAYGLRCPARGSWWLGGEDPKRGDIVCFFPPTGDKDVFIKRVIGIAGDTIKIKDNEIRVIPAKSSDLESNKYLLKTEVAIRSVDKIITRSPDITPLKEDNGEKSYFIQNVPSHNQREEKEWIVPENSYFVMGDNRGNSQDSRSFECVPRKNIIAKPIFIVSNMQWFSGHVFPKINWARCFRFPR